ncbi:MAG: GNAT family N-acetyltransferase [Bauldia sp.]|nr:GNAT family N-acetyltransferase [Bauldia sp.]
MIPFFPSSRVYLDTLGPADADALAEIHGEGFPRPWLAGDFASLIAGANVGAVGMRRQSPFGFSRLVGFVLYRHASDEAEILSIAVRRSHRGRGHGRLLMDEALRRLYRDRIKTCFLEVDPGNEAAVSLYRKIGFEQVGSRKDYYKRPGGGAGSALILRLELQ